MKQSHEPSTEASKLSLSEASKLISKPENTIREWIKTSKVAAHRDPRGRWLIKREDLMAFVVTKGSTEGRPGASAKSTPKLHLNSESSTVTSEQRYIRSLEDSLDRERRINDELRTRILMMEQERTQHLAEMRSLLSKDFSSKDGILSRWIRK